MENEEEQVEKWKQDWLKDVRERQRRAWEHGRHSFTVPGERIL